MYHINMEWSYFLCIFFTVILALYSNLLAFSLSTIVRKGVLDKDSFVVLKILSKEQHMTKTRFFHFGFFLLKTYGQKKLFLDIRSSLIEDRSIHTRAHYCRMNYSQPAHLLTIYQIGRLGYVNNGLMTVITIIYLLTPHAYYHYDCHNTVTTIISISTDHYVLV